SAILKPVAVAASKSTNTTAMYFHPRERAACRVPLPPEGARRLQGAVGESQGSGPRGLGRPDTSSAAPGGGPATRAHVGDASQEGPASRARPGDEAQGPGRRALARPGGESAARPGGAPSASAWVEREAAKVGRHYDEHAGEFSKAGLTRER